MSLQSELHKYLIRYVGNPFVLLWTGDLSMLHEAREYDKVYTFPRRKLLERQWTKLMRVLKEAYESCPYYTELFDRHGIKPESIQSPEDFARIPPLTKADIRKHGDKLISRKVDKRTLLESGTAGSTDVPLPFWRSKEAVRTKWAQTFSLNKWYGWECGDKVAYLWAVSRDFYNPLSAKAKIRKFLTTQNIMLPARPLSRVILEDYWRRLLRYSPKLIQCYPHSLYLLASLMESSHYEDLGVVHVEKSFPELGAVISTAEPLYDFQREKLRKVFSCDIYDQYGARETGLIATECPQEHSLHINTEGVYVEVIANGRPAAENEIGEIIVTDLINTAMPFIRYQITDVGSVSQKLCKCGCELPVMKSIVGRTTDIIVLPDGRFFTGISFTLSLIRDCPGIRQVQLIQEELTRFIVKYVPTEAFTDNDLVMLKKNFETIFAVGLDLTMERVDEIPRDPSGKSRFSISKVKIDFLK